MTPGQTLKLLQDHESRNVTFIEPDGSWPIVWERAKGVHVWDANWKKYLDLTAAFGVAAAGHANPAVVRAGQKQMARLPHAMGDVHPHALKATLAGELSRLTFERWALGEAEGQRPKAKVRHPASTAAKTIFCNSGFEAVEAALKTALLATGKPGVIAFEGAYHGLGYGTLNVTHREHFRSPFHRQLREFGSFVPFPSIGQASSLSRISTRTASNESQLASPALVALQSQIRQLFRRKEIGALLVEPVQVRGGINIPPPEFLPLLLRLCREHRALLILDEIYTGFGRTGKWFACEHSRVVPDIICLGKALTGGFPLSACVGRSDLMDLAWPPSRGEAIHTSTFLGHPVGCAMALAQIRQIEQRRLVQRSAGLGKVLLSSLSALGPHLSRFNRTSQRPNDLIVAARGLGLLAGVELCRADGSPATDFCVAAIKSLLRRGFILLPEGEHANVISFTPPLTISRDQLRGALGALEQTLTRQ
jgi:4-aminobutyrate aminotransferase-like enzyme